MTSFLCFQILQKSISTTVFLIFKKKPPQTEKTSPKPTLPLTRGSPSHLGVSFSVRKADFRGDTFRKLVEALRGKRAKIELFCSQLCDFVGAPWLSYPGDMLIITGLYY